MGLPANTEDHIRWIDELRHDLDVEYFGRTNQGEDPAYLAAAGFARMALGRLTIMAFVPVLCPLPSVPSPAELHARLLVAAVDVLEHNHALNSDSSCHPWKWV